MDGEKDRELYCTSNVGTYTHMYEAQRKRVGRNMWQVAVWVRSPYKGTESLRRAVECTLYKVSSCIRPAPIACSSGCRRSDTRLQRQPAARSLSLIISRSGTVYLQRQCVRSYRVNGHDDGRARSDVVCAVKYVLGRRRSLEKEGVVT